VLVPTPRAALLAALLGVSFLAYPGAGLPVWPTVAVVTGLVVVLALVDGAIGTAPRHLVVRREHPPVVVLGQSATVRWRLRSTARRDLRVSCADELAPSLRPAGRRFRVKVPAGGTVSVDTSIRPIRRGRFELSELTLRIDGRLGLGSRQRTVPLSTVLWVHPPFRRRDEAELAIRRARVMEQGSRTARGLGGGTEFEQLREYGPDDEFRRIDWTATARAGRTIVRTYRAERNQRVLILLDNGRTMAGRVDGVPRVEHAIDAAMMLTAVSTRLGDRCGLVAFDREVRAVVPPSQRPSQLATVTEAMFDLEPELAESDYAGAFAEALARFRRRSMLVLLTDLVDHAVEESLLPALPLITRTHLVVVGAVRDPQVASWAAGEDHDDVDDETAVYRQAAAVMSDAARRRTVARLRGMGVTVIDEPSDRLPGALTDAYLELKGTGRL